MSRALLLAAMLMFVASDASAAKKPTNPDDELPVINNVCTTDSECILVQGTWCKNVSAIPKNELHNWKAIDHSTTIKSRHENTPCVEGDITNIDLYQAQCAEGKCQLIFKSR